MADARYTQLHHDILKTTKESTGGLVNMQTLQTRIDQAYRPKSKPDAFFSQPIGQASGELVDVGYLEPFDRVKHRRSAVASEYRITPAGQDAMTEWEKKTREERIRDSTPMDLKGEPMADPVLPSSMREGPAKVNAKVVGKGAPKGKSKGKSKMSKPSAPAAGKGGGGAKGKLVQRPAAPGAIPRRPKTA